jgi:hypothetical protein
MHPGLSRGTRFLCKHARPDGPMVIVLFLLTISTFKLTLGPGGASITEFHSPMGHQVEFKRSNSAVETIVRVCRLLHHIIVSSAMCCTSSVKVFHEIHVSESCLVLAQCLKSFRNITESIVARKPLLLT